MTQEHDILSLEKNVEQRISVYGDQAPQTVEAVVNLLQAYCKVAALYFEQGA
jgi:hypothetical protein